MRHPLVLRSTLALATAFLAVSAPAAIADPPEHVFQGHLPGSHANVHQHTRAHGHTPFNGTQAVHQDSAPAAAAASDSDVDAATAAIAGGAAFALGAALSSLIVIRRQGPRPAA